MITSSGIFSLRDYKVIFLSLLGGALEVFDFIIFVFLATTIADVFFPPNTPPWIRFIQSMTILSVGYLARPFGGLVIAHFSDKYGRKKMFNLTVLFMALPCLVIGILPSYASIGPGAPLSLLIARLIQGAALGGEVPNAWVFVAEHTASRHRGLALGILQAGLTFGYMLAALTIVVISSHYSSEELRSWAWRIPFIIGGVLGFISVFMRRWLQETPVFLTLQRNSGLTRKMPVMDVFRHHRKVAIPATLLTAILTSAVIVTVVILPLVLQKFRHFSPVATFQISCAGILALNTGCILAGWLSDRTGAWRTMMIYSILLAVALTVMVTCIGESFRVILGCYLLLGLSCGAIAAVPAVIVQLFPSQVKVTGISLIYNIGYSACSSILPLLLLSLYSQGSWTLIVFGWLVALTGVITFVGYRKINMY